MKFVVIAEVVQRLKQQTNRHAQTSDIYAVAMMRFCKISLLKSNKKKASCFNWSHRFRSPSETCFFPDSSADKMLPSRYEMPYKLAFISRDRELAFICA